MESYETLRDARAPSAMAARAESSLLETVVSAEQLRDALGRHRRASTRKLGAKLLDLELITPEQLSAALAIQRGDSARHLGHILVDLGYLTKAELHQVLCLQLGIPLIRLPHFDIQRAVRRLLPEELIEECRVVPLCLIDGRLVVAVSDPLDSRSLDRVRFFAQAPLVPVMAPPQDIEQAIRTHYSPVPDIPFGPGSTSTFSQKRPHAALEGVTAPQNELEASILDFVSTMISDAHQSGASDIHLDASADGQQLVVRFRRHGRLVPYMDVPRHLRRGVMKHIKALAGVQIMPRGRAEEGRLDVQVGHLHLQIHVLAVPTRDGSEHIAMKLLRASDWPRLESLGLGDGQLEMLKQFLTRPNGLIMLAGPAESGKTTTAHALLKLVSPGATIWTAERGLDADHVGVSQIQIDPAGGWDYAAAMGAIVRADPDVILAGDVPDHETAALALQSALHDCRVISAVRSTTAAGAFTRLLELGVNAFSLSDALLGIVAQRLARRLCAACRVSRPLFPGETQALLAEYCDGTPLEPPHAYAEWRSRFGEHLVLYSAPGCDKCGGTGYDGYVGLFEILPASPTIRELIRQRRPIDDIAAAAMREGMRTIKQDGIGKALAGDCDLREVRAATA